MKLLANKVHIKGMKYYWLTKCINKNHNVNGYVSHNHPYIRAVLYELCLPAASSTHPYILLISARNLFHKFLFVFFFSLLQ